MDEVTDELLTDGIKLFADAMATLLAGIEKIRSSGSSGGVRVVVPELPGSPTSRFSQTRSRPALS